MAPPEIMRNEVVAAGTEDARFIDTERRFPEHTVDQHARSMQLHRRSGYTTDSMAPLIRPTAPHPCDWLRG
jgi:hypothetical protein